jgi:hypothetical protein
MRINTSARLEALRISLAVLAVFAVVGILPAGKLPRYRAVQALARERLEAPTTE